MTEEELAAWYEADEIAYAAAVAACTERWTVAEALAADHPDGPLAVVGSPQCQHWTKAQRSAYWAVAAREWEARRPERDRERMRRRLRVLDGGGEPVEQLTLPLLTAIRDDDPGGDAS